MRPSPTRISCWAGSIPRTSSAGGLPSTELLARAALDRLGARLGIDAVEVASAMVRVTNENMANAIRIVTVEQGIDPRDFVLVAFGGAGATHGAEIADAIGMRRVFVPPNPGLCSAFGAMAAEVRVDVVKSVFLTDRRTDAAEVAELFAGLESRARRTSQPRAPERASPRSGGRSRCATRARTTSRRSPFPRTDLGDVLAAVYTDYNRLYEEFYGYRLDGIPIELVRLTVVATRSADDLPALDEPSSSEAPGAVRNVFFLDRAASSRRRSDTVRVSPPER